MYFFDLDGTLLDSNGIWLTLTGTFWPGTGYPPCPRTIRNM